MNYRPLHPWTASPQEAIRIQNSLRDQVRIAPLEKAARFVAGADLSFNRGSNLLFAAFVVLELPTLKIVARSEGVTEVDFPYIPGLLSFREIPALLKAWKSLDFAPDVIVLDGQGVAHPRGLGIASHFGLWVDRPTLGCAKSILVGHLSPQDLKTPAGSTALLRWRDRTVGVALRTRAGIQPVYLSPGHRIDFKDSVDLILKTVTRYRIPEPTRQAHLAANELRRRAGRAAS